MTNRNLKFCTLAALIAVLLAVPAVAQVDDHRKIKYPALPEFDIAQPEIYDLPNGMKIFLMEDHELPLIRVIARIRTGGNYEPLGKAGLGGIFGQTQREGGTTSMTGDEIDDFLAVRAAFVETGMGGESGSASMNCLKEDFDEVFALFSDVLRKPAFSEDKIELAKVQEETSIARRNDSIGGITGREFARLMYGHDSPLSRMSEYATIASIDRDDLIAWHQKYYHPNNVYLGFVGDFNSNEMKRKIMAQFGDWKKGPSVELPELAIDRSNQPSTHFIEKKDVTQAYVRLGHLGIKVDNPDYFAAQVMNEVFGGGFASRLFSNVRSKKGLAYNVFGSLGAGFTRPGFFQVGLSTKSETMGEAVDALKEEIESIINSPATDKELDKAKESILNSFVFNYDSRGEVLGQQMSYTYYGLPVDFLEQYRGRIEKVTQAEVAAVAKKYLHPDRLKLLVVGNPDEFDRPMDSFGKVAQLDITIPEPPDSAPAVVKTAASMKSGKELFSRMVRKIGGGTRGKIDAVKVSTNIELTMGGQTMAATQNGLYQFPGNIRESVKLPTGEQTMVISDGKGVASMGGQSQPLPEDAVRESIASLGRELLFLVSNFDHPKMEVVGAGSEDVGGTACTILAVDFNGTKSRLWIDGQGQVLKQAFRGKHPMTRSPAEVEVVFSDYRSVGGRLLPHKRVMSFDGERTIEVNVNSIEVNPTVESDSFALPDAA